MNSTNFPRRALAIRMAALPLALTAACRGQTPSNSSSVAVALSDGLSHASEAIHQELLFNASPHRVYDALTSGKSFDAITRLSDGDALLKAADAKPTTINGEVGDTFTLFGGYITGRNLEMLPAERLVQAWRATKTKLLFDHEVSLTAKGPAWRKDGTRTNGGPLTTFLAQG